MLELSQIHNNMDFCAHKSGGEVFRSKISENIFSVDTALKVDKDKTYVFGEGDGDMESFKDIWQMVQNYCRENVNEVQQHGDSAVWRSLDGD